MVQRDYGYNQPLGLPGGIYDLSPKKIVTRTTDPNVSVKPGMGLVRGASEGETVKLPVTGTAADKFEGILVHGSKQLEQTMNGAVATAGSDTVGLMQRGRIWGLIASTATIAYGKGVALILSGENVGRFTDASDESESQKVALPDVIFTGRADKDNEIAVIEMK